MHHLHFDSCPSTQKYLKINIVELLNIDSNILISTKSQTEGIGRTDNRWINLENSIAFSFSLRPCDTTTLTPLEIAILLVDFFEEKFSTRIGLKWPNDLLTNEMKKCGGIICNYHSDKTIIVGIGINVGKFKTNISEISEINAGSINEKIKISDKEANDLPLEIYKFILKNRMKNDLIPDMWEKKCCHRSKNIKIIDSSGEYSGIFSGIEKDGSAILKAQDGNIKKFISGSLSMIE